MSVVQSYNTAISRKNASAPLRFLEKNNYLNGRILDYGSGKGADHRHLLEKGYCSEQYDPYWSPLDLSGKTFDTILCTYVLNVVDKSSEEQIIDSIKNLLNTGGRAYLSVRRDIKKDGPTSRGYQRTVSLPLKIVKEVGGFCIYELSK